MHLSRMGIFTVHPSITIEITEIHPEPQNLTMYDKKQVESMANSQGAAGPAKTDSAHYASRRHHDI